jgi:hypothetical protein
MKMTPRPPAQPGPGFRAGATRRAWLCLGVAAALAGCGWIPRATTENDPETKALLAAAAQFPGEQHGFSPLPAHPRAISLEPVSASDAYDRMLNIADRTTRTIAFKQTPQGWVVVHEQECFEGPNDYDAPDGGRTKEKIWLTFETVPVATGTPGTLVIDYDGANRELLEKKELTLKDVQPVLKQWGY